MQATMLARTPAANPALDRFRADPVKIMADANLVPDQWQTTLLSSNSPRTLLLCSRQAGKSTVAAALALQAALLQAPALVLLLSPALRQSAELLLKALELYKAIGRPVATIRPRDNALKIELANGSRIISLPGNEATIRGYSGAALLVIDEASRVPDDLYRSVRPMLAVSRGRLVCLSTPFGKRGWFFEEWQGENRWERVRITADECPRISKEFLEEEQRALGERWYRQEYFCSFEDAVDSVFSHADVLAATQTDLQPLFIG